MPLLSDSLRRIMVPRKPGEPDSIVIRLRRRTMQVGAAVFALTAAAQIGCAPLLAYYSYELSPVALLANVLIVPIAPPLLACGFGGAVCASIAQWLAQPFDLAANWLLGYVIGVVRACAALPWAGLSVSPPPVPFVVGYYLIVWGLAVWLRRRIARGGERRDDMDATIDRADGRDEAGTPVEVEVSRRALTASMLPRRDPVVRFAAGSGPMWLLLALLIGGHLALFGWSRFQSRHAAVLRITFLDVGQGDAAVLETPGGRVIVVDAGGMGSTEGDDEGRRVVGPYLRYRGINAIDALILTHPHTDHIGGAATLLHDFQVGLVCDNGQDTSEPEALRALEEARRQGVAYRPLQRGQSLDMPDGVTLQVLAPTAAETQGTANNASVVLLARYGRTAFLLTGDAEAAEETDLLHDGQPVACDVLKAGHHGSRTSSTPAFLAEAHPRWAVVSVGAHNLYGHPGPEVLARLQENGVTICRTDRNGAVTCLSDGVTCTVTPLRRER